MPRILLVYANPAITTTPVPPYGMEKVAQAFRLAGCEVQMVATWIEHDPVDALISAMDQWPPDLIGFSVRNVDDTLVVRSADGTGDLDLTFYLDEVRDLVRVAQERVGSSNVLVGGSAIGAGPQAIVEYLGAEWGIAGPAEDLCWRIGRALVRGEGLQIPDDPRVVRSGQPVRRGRGYASAWRPPPGPSVRMGPYLGLAMARGGRAAVQIANGCDRRCVFCVEARASGGTVTQRSVQDVVAEVRLLKDSGVDRVWLTTSELNVPNERFAIELLRALEGCGVDLRLYLQPAPVSDDLLDAMEAAGIDPTGLNFEFGHLSDTILRAGGGPANWRHIEQLADRFLARGYRQLGGSMLFGAHWLESMATVQQAIERIQQLDAAFPDGLGLAYAAGGRVYPNTGLADWINEHREVASAHLYGEDDPTFVRPVVYCHPMAPRALLQHVQRKLGETRGPIGPMNTETPRGVDDLRAESLVNRGIWRLQERRAEEAERCFADAVQTVPNHLEALKQLALVRGNLLGDGRGALDALRALLAALPPSDGRHVEVQRQVSQLEQALVGG